MEVQAETSQAAASQLADVSQPDQVMKAQLELLMKIHETLESVLTKAGYIEGRMDSGTSEIQDSLRHLQQKITEFSQSISGSVLFRQWILLEKQGYMRSRMSTGWDQGDVVEGWHRLCEAADKISRLEAASKVMRRQLRLKKSEIPKPQFEEAVQDQLRLESNLSLAEWKAEIKGMSLETLPEGGALMKVEAEYVLNEYEKAKAYFIEMKTKTEGMLSLMVRQEE